MTSIWQAPRIADRVSVADAATLLAISPSKVRRLLASGELKAVQGGKTLNLDGDHLRRLLEDSIEKVGFRRVVPSSGDADELQRDVATLRRVVHNLRVASELHLEAVGALVPQPELDR